MVFLFLLPWLQAFAHTSTAQNLNHHRGQIIEPQNVVYYGEPVLSNVKIYAVFWGATVNAEVQAEIGDFYTAISNSTYLDLLAGRTFLLPSYF